MADGTPGPAGPPSPDGAPSPDSAASPRILVVVPTYNERANLDRIVPMILAQGPAFHVLVVDDASPDGTGEAADALAAQHQRMDVLHRPGKLGLGTAYVEGFTWGLKRPFDLFVSMDADLSHPPDMLPRLASEGQSAGAGVVVGSRYLGGSIRVVNWPMARLLVSLFGSWYARTITGMPVSDATGGFNLYSRQALESVDLASIESSGYSFQIELKFRVWRTGLAVREVPFVFTERRSGESKMSRRILWEAVWRVWKLRWARLFGRR